MNEKINSSEWYESIRSGVGLNMGIILEKSKLIFDELVGTSSFDDVFKNSIRDYYTYGFKSYDQNIKGSQSVKDRWKIFSKILGEKWYFEKEKRKKSDCFENNAFRNR